MRSGGALVYISAIGAVAGEAILAGAEEGPVGILTAAIFVTVVKVVIALVDVSAIKSIPKEARLASAIKRSRDIGTLRFWMAGVRSQRTFVLVGASQTGPLVPRVAGAGERSGDVCAGGIVIAVVNVGSALIDILTGVIEKARQALKTMLALFAIEPLSVSKAVETFSLLVAAARMLVTVAANAFKSANRGIFKGGAGTEANIVVKETIRT